MKGIGAIVLSVLMLVACDERNPIGPDGGSATDSVVKGLQQQGATVVRVEVMPRSSHPFFRTNAVRFQVNGENVWIFEYPTAGAADQDAALVSPDGSAIGRTQVEWIDVPRFYKKDRVIVLYVGKNPAAIGPLEAVLGAPFAGGRR